MLVQLSSQNEMDQSPEILRVNFVLVLPKGKFFKLENLLLNFTNQTFLKDIFLEQLKIDDPEPLCMENKNLTIKLTCFLNNHIIDLPQTVLFVN